jgi:hypothetical protein
MFPFFNRNKTAADKVSQSLQLIADSGRSSLQSEPVSVQQHQTEKRSILQNLFQSDDMITLPNNTTVDIPGDGKRTVRLYAQSLTGEDSLTESTNSSYCQTQELVSFNWQPQSRVNLLAVHRTKPLIAYVINTTYHKAFVTGKQLAPKPEDQTVRLINYENNCRTLCAPISAAPITDIAFSFDSPKRPNSNIIAVIDRSGIINLLSFTACTFPNAPPQMALTRFLTIRPPANISFLSEYVRLCWCVYVPGVEEDEEPPVDPSLRLVVTSGTNLEVFSFNDFHLRETGADVDRSHFKSHVGEYYVAPAIHKKDIVSAAVSNDGSMTCTASLSNMLLFYSIDDMECRLQYLREWNPQLQAGEHISQFFFLDDIDYLIQHPQQMFWGYLFVGSSGGRMQIFDLQDKQWSVVQDIQIMGEDNASAGTGFSYHVDKSSKVILAVRHHSAFVFLLQFSETGEGTRIPVMKQVSRMQLYNDVISMQVKQTSEHEIDIFCITLKNLQRLTIDINEMNASKMVSKPHRPATDVSTPSSLAKALIKDRKLSHATSPKEQELLDKLQEKSKEIISMKQKHDPSHSVAVSSASVSTPESAARTRPAVTAVADPMTSIMEKLSLSNGQSPKAKQQPQTPSLSSASPATPAPALNDMAKIMLIEDKLKTFENRFTKQMDLLSGTISAGFKAVQGEVGQLKQEIQQQPSKQSVDRSLVELTISKAVDQCMKQMNVVVSKGLKDFFDQTDVAVSELQATVTQSNADLKSSFSETQTQIESVKSKMDLFEMQMERLDAQQQLLLFRYQQLISQTD